MNINILDDVAVSPNLDKGAQNDVCVYPLTCRLNNSDLLCVYRQGREKHSLDGILIAQRSTDGGANWSEQIIIYDGRQKTHPESVHTGALCQVAEGTVLAIFTTVDARQQGIYVFSEEGRKLTSHLYTARSEDGGETWSTPKSHNLVGAPQNIYIGSRPFLLPGGDLFLPVEATGVHGGQIVLATISSDGGLTFQPVITCAEDKADTLSYGDPKFTLLPEGRIVMLIWTFLNATEETIAVHRCVSIDRGRSWSPPVSTHVQSQIMTPLALDSNRMIAAGNVRTVPAGIRLWFSSDAGETWSTSSPTQMWDAQDEKMKGILLTVEEKPLRNTPEGIWNELPGFVFGAPDLVPLGNNTILLTYYATLNGITHVRTCRFKVAL
jgi:hypothetical protein